jgi:hypothetical protein
MSKIIYEYVNYPVENAKSHRQFIEYLLDSETDFREAVRDMCFPNVDWNNIPVELTEDNVTECYALDWINYNRTKRLFTQSKVSTFIRELFDFCSAPEYEKLLRKYDDVYEDSRFADYLRKKYNKTEELER